MAQDQIDWTTITVPREVKEELDAERGSRPWGAFLEELRQTHADPITLNDAEELAAFLNEELDVAVDYAEIESRVKRALEAAHQ